MTIDRTTATKQVPMSPLRKTALIAGVLYLLTFVSIPHWRPQYAAGGHNRERRDSGRHVVRR